MAAWRPTDRDRDPISDTRALGSQFKSGAWGCKRFCGKRLAVAVPLLWHYLTANGLEMVEPRTFSIFSGVSC